MTRVFVDDTSLTGIGDALRSRYGNETTYKPSQMRAAVAAVPNAYVAADEGKVVSSGTLVSQTSVTKTTNGTYDTTLNDEVVVAVPLGTKRITENGIFTAADDDLAGYSSVNVSVSGGGGGGGGVSTPTFLANSTQADILVNEYYTSYDEDNNEWGDLTVTNATFTAIGMTVKPSEGFTYDLSQQNRPVTIYVIAELFAEASADVTTFISCTNAASRGNAPSIYQRDSTKVWCVGSYEIESFQNSVSTSGIAVLTLAVDPSEMKAYGYANGMSLGYVSFNSSGRYCTFNGISGHDRYSGTSYYLYIGIVNGCESSATIIANQEDMLDFLDEAIIGIESSGGGGIQSISKSDWDALTKTQKNSYGLVNIITSSSGYTRGLLVNGSDYSYAQEYLPYSDDSYVGCVAYYDNFNSNELAWGDGESPVSMSATCTRYQSEDAVYFDAKTSQKQIRIPLGGTQTDFTVYVVAKGISYANGDVIILGSVYSWSSGNEIILYHRTGTTWISSIYGSDVELIDTAGGYVAVAIRSNSMKASWFAHDGASRKNVIYNKHGEYFTFGYYGTTYSTDLAVKFVGYVSHAETDLTIQSNLENLAEIYSLS